MHFLYLLFFLNFSAIAQVNFQWLGISSFILSDQSTTLMFDPAITRAQLLDYLPWKTIESNPAEVNYWMKRCSVQNLDATFVNHAHVDHVIDAPYVVKKFGGKLYGSSSVSNVGLGHGLNASQIQVLIPDKELKIGHFTITPITTPHAPHFLDILLMDGHIRTPLHSPTSVWNYLVGDTYSFLITHPSGKILFQSIGKIYQPDILKSIKVDVLLLTIANRNSTEELIEKRVLTSEAKTIIPLHYDHFFFPMRRDNKIDHLWGVKVDEFKEKLNILAKDTKAIWPHYCDKVTLF